MFLKDSTLNFAKTIICIALMQRRRCADLVLRSFMVTLMRCYKMRPFRCQQFLSLFVDLEFPVTHATLRRVSLVRFKGIQSMSNGYFKAFWVAAVFALPFFQTIQNQNAWSWKYRRLYAYDFPQVWNFQLYAMESATAKWLAWTRPDATPMVSPIVSSAIHRCLHGSIISKWLTDFA